MHHAQPQGASQHLPVNAQIQEDVCVGAQAVARTLPLPQAAATHDSPNSAEPIHWHRNQSRTRNQTQNQTQTMRNNAGQRPSKSQ